MKAYIRMNHHQTTWKLDICIWRYIYLFKYVWILIHKITCIFSQVSEEGKHILQSKRRQNLLEQVSSVREKIGEMEKVKCFNGESIKGSKLLTIHHSIQPARERERWQESSSSIASSSFPIIILTENKDKTKTVSWQVFGVDKHFIMHLFYLTHILFFFLFNSKIKWSLSDDSAYILWTIRVLLYSIHLCTHVDATHEAIYAMLDDFQLNESLYSFCWCWK